MKEMNELEMHLRSWAPRRPSARLRNRIFAQAPRNPEPTFRFAWLGPATAALLFMAVLLNQRTSPGISGPGSNAMVAMMISNPSAPAYLPGSFKAEHNNLTAETFEWTNDSRSTSSIRSLSHPRGSQSR